jgi:transcriptional regulator with XRE-family HTH domain
MSTINLDSGTNIDIGQAAIPPAVVQMPLHRLAAVRAARKVSPSVLAQRLNITAEQVKLREQGSVDLPLSELYKWAAALEVPVERLLVNSDVVVPVPEMDLESAKELLRTARALCAETDHPNLERMATALVEQIVELAPELKDAALAPAAEGRRRAGRAHSMVVPQLPENVFIKPIE